MCLFRVVINGKGHRPGLFTPPVALSGSSLMAHSGGGSYYPYDNSYDLSYYDDVPLVRDVRRNSKQRESLVGLTAGDAARIAGHVLRVPEKNFKCNRSL
jgi:hypothetical protein